ncbi:MAG: single-stranded DNA-binding protein [Cyclobacteriaceae bacterium]
MNLSNKATLFGHVGSDPVVKELDSGKTVANFSLATSDSYRDNEGEKVTNTEWHNIVAWGKQAELVGKLVKKGTALLLEGKITHRVYKHDTKGDVQVTEILLNGFVLTQPKQD